MEVLERVIPSQSLVVWVGAASFACRGKCLLWRRLVTAPLTSHHSTTCSSCAFTVEVGFTLKWDVFSVVIGTKWSLQACCWSREVAFVNPSRVINWAQTFSTYLFWLSYYGLMCFWRNVTCWPWLNDDIELRKFAHLPSGSGHCGLRCCATAKREAVSGAKQLGGRVAQLNTLLLFPSTHAAHTLVWCAPLVCVSVKRDGQRKSSLLFSSIEELTHFNRGSSNTSRVRVVNRKGEKHRSASERAIKYLFHHLRVRLVSWTRYHNNGVLLLLLFNNTPEIYTREHEKNTHFIFFNASIGFS